jgi:hypothetical protein
MLVSSLLLIVTASACSCWSHQALNGQGWSVEDQHRWYRASQGSRLLPHSWLLALEEKESNRALLSPENIERFRYLPPAPDDPIRLPVGFAIDRTADDDLGVTGFHWFEDQKSGEAWVGLNCSACHTAEISYQGHSMRIDGGPTIADFQGFRETLNEALVATREDPAKWERFATAVLKDQPADKKDKNREVLRTALTTLIDWQQALAKLTVTSSRYGNARLDAVGHIFNRVALLARADNQFGAPPDAPVSYPFIWNTHQHDFVQWNGIAGNRGFKLPSGETFDVGALGRNTGEVIGVFADVEITPNAGLGGYRSSVNVLNLDAMETQLSRLKSPEWPAAIFGPYDTTLAQEGRGVFETKGCVHCHSHLDRNDLKTPIVASMSPIWGQPEDHPVGTDPWMACNAFTYQARAGKLEGTSKGFFDSDTKIAKIDFTKDLLGTAAVGVLAGKKRQIAHTAARALFGLPRKPEVTALREALRVGAQQDKSGRLNDCKANQTNRLLAYKGRPLNGIWATAPYLHNGSVKSLYELLLPPAERSRSFSVGNREYDPVNVGYVDAPSPNGSRFETHDAAGQPIPGNSNDGHDYGNGSLSERERRALVEYMKSL